MPRKRKKDLERVNAMKAKKHNVFPTTSLIKALKILVEKAEGETCDNAMWDYAYQSGWFDFKVDHDCELFLAMCVVPIDKIYFKDRRIYNSITKTYPAGIHFNGPRGEHPNGINFEGMYKLYLENR